MMVPPSGCLGLDTTARKGTRYMRPARSQPHAIERLSYFNPSTAAPVAMPAPRFAPAIALALPPTPIIRHDTQPQGRLIPGFTANTPTIAFVVTDDSG